MCPFTFFCGSYNTKGSGSAPLLAGVEIAKEVFRRFDPTMQVEVLMGDGTRVKKGDIAMVVTGKIRSLLQT